MIPKVVQTLVRRGGITNYHLIAYSFSNISAKNYQNQLTCIEVAGLSGARSEISGQFLARDVIYTSRAYATMSSVCLSVTQVHWRIIANLGFKL